jgi:hypothetical protein
MNRIVYYNRVKQRTAVFRNSRGLFNNIRQIKQIHCVNQFIVMRFKILISYLWRFETVPVNQKLNALMKNYYF